MACVHVPSPFHFKRRDLFSFARYLSSQAQVQVANTQNRIVALEQEFQQANAYAQQRFDQISKVLLNAEASPAE